MSFHRLFCILVVWVPSYAHHHLMNVSTSNTGPAIINASGYIGRKIINYLFWKVSCGDAQLLGAAAEAPHHLAAAEIRQVPHDSVRLGLGLRPGLQVRRSRRRSGARKPRTGRGTRAGARLMPEFPRGRPGGQALNGPAGARRHAAGSPSPN